MRRASPVVFCAVDAFLGARGEPLFGFEYFTSALQDSGIPCVWVSQRTRAQLDEPRRRLGASDPFIAEDGSGVYLPEDYFHQKQAKTVRLGRFLCIPLAQNQPASAEALDKLAQETQVGVVPLRSLKPRELAQNAGSPVRQAELMRSRDFDELFFFAGASDAQIRQFIRVGQEHRLVIRPHECFWSLAIGASVPKCVQQLARLYDQESHKRALRIGITVTRDVNALSAACDRVLQVIAGKPRGNEGETPEAVKYQYSLSAPDLWQEIFSAVRSMAGAPWKQSV